jgi:hypothetical protein
MLNKLRYIDWSFSSTAEAATGVMLMVAIVVSYFAT